LKRAIPILIIVVGLGLLYPIERWISRTSPREVISEETLFFSSGKTIKKMSLGLEGLAADIYWIRAVQYFGRKLIDSGQPLSAAASSNIRMDLLAPLLNIIVELDPHHISAYRFGAIFLPERDLAAAIDLLEKGIRENPNEWRLYQDIAYINWQAGDYEKAAEWYERGSRIPEARWWMRDLAGLMRIKGGSRETARAIYERYLESDDQQIRSQAIERLKQLRSLDELDAINALLARYREQAGYCAASLRELAPRLRAMGIKLNTDLIPVDPNGFAYVLDQSSCKARLAPDSTIPIS
jgi:tetratricopeptide (TPR) repeat protein